MHGINTGTALTLWAVGPMPVCGLQPVPEFPASAAAASEPMSMINRWADVHGQVHYSDKLHLKTSARLTSWKHCKCPPPERKTQAAAQLQQYRKYLGQQRYAERWALFDAVQARNQACVDDGNCRRCPMVPAEPQC